MTDYNMGSLSCQWMRLKRANVRLAHALRRLGDRRWGVVLQCASQVRVRYCPSCGRAHAQGANCCRHRLCPVCQVRRSRKLAHQAIAAAQWLTSEGRLDGVRMGLVTLTQRNVPADLLPGMNVSAEIIIEQAEHVLTVPLSAVSRGDTVKVLPADAISEKDGSIDPSKAEERTVTLGVNDSTYVEITNGLSEGDLVLVEQLAADPLTMQQLAEDM